MLANSAEFARHLQWWLQQASSGNDCWKLTKELSKRLGIHSKDGLFLRLLKHYLAYLLLRPSVPEFRAGDLITTPVYKRTTIWLVMGSKYVIRRPGDASTMRQMILDGKDIELHFGYKYKIPVKGLLKVHHKMRQILKTGDLRCIALSINPKNNLIRAQLIVDRTDFRIKLRKLKVPRAKVVGIDLNKIGKHIVAFSIPYTDPELNKLCAKYWQYKNLIRELQSKLDRQRCPNPRLHEQIRQLHRKRKDIRRAIHNMLVPLIASVVASSGAETLVMERLHMKPHGLKKGLAEAVNSMPKTGLQLRLQQALPNVEIVSIDPWKPAFKIHANCGGKLDRKKNWHYPPCSKCKIEVNSHENAAKMLVKYHLSSSTIQQFLSSLTGRKP
ncbi:MAG: hypothetical protein D6732_21820 [Methanobacteriota archaeon]|nr:MAG: hypothetical protein D6732_21820 [Euryarchaeota archaeon]